MDDALLVDVAYCFEHLLDDQETLLLWESLDILFQLIVQCLPFEQLHDQTDIFRVIIDFVEFDDVRVIQAPQNLDLCHHCREPVLDIPDGLLVDAFHSVLFLIKLRMTLKNLISNIFNANFGCNSFSHLSQRSVKDPHWPLLNFGGN